MSSYNSRLSYAEVFAHLESFAEQVDDECLTKEEKNLALCVFYPCKVKMMWGGDDAPIVRLAQFVAFKDSAVQCRLAGEIENALAWEEQAEKVRPREE
jgi:hypothetical protein